MRASNSTRVVSLALLVAVTGLNTSPAVAQDGPVELSDLTRIVYLAHPSISPSGESVALVTRRANLDDNSWDASLVLIDLATGGQKELMPQRTSVEDPRWSPAGDRLAFLDTDSGATQLYVLPMEGGEARRLTEGDEDVRFYRWSADGRSIVFARQDEEEEEEEAAAEREGTERHNRSFEVGHNSYLTRSAPRPTHLWRIPGEGGEAIRLTEGPENVAGFEWAPGGDALVLEMQPSAHSGAFLHSSLQVLELGTGERHPVGLEGAYPLNGLLGSGAEFSPDGRLISYHGPRGRGGDYVPYGIFVVPRTGGEPRDISAGIDRDLTSMTWLPNGSAILAKAPDRTTVGVWLQPLDGPARRLDLGTVQPLSDLYMSERGRVAFIGTEPHGPPELYVMEGPGWTPRRVTSFNEEVASREMGRVETVSWPGPDRFEMTGVLIYPLGYQEGQKYPLVLEIHGGPMGTSIEGFSPLEEYPSGVHQILAAQGWLVFQPNYRGSNNLGAAFQRAIINDAGDGPGRDIMSGVELLKRRGIVDESRIAVSGWSYGGFLTAWLTAHYDGWAAAVAGAAPTDWLDDYTSAVIVGEGHWLGGSPWLNDNFENYRRQSAITYAHRIRTPTLILATTGDEQVPITGSYKLYHALKDNGVEVKFVAYPVAGHGPSDPVHTLDVFRRTIDWIGKHFANGEGR